MNRTTVIGSFLAVSLTANLFLAYTTLDTAISLDHCRMEQSARSNNE